MKTTRRFSENHTLFWWKQHVVLVKTSRRLLLDSAHFATSWAKMCNECYNMGLTNLRTEGYVTTCDTCDSKKCKIPVGCARAHAREGGDSFLNSKKTLSMVSCQSTDFDREVGRHSMRKSSGYFTRDKLLSDFQCLALVYISMPCILSLYQTPKGGAAKLSFATPPAVV